MKIPCPICGLGTYVPEKKISNHDFEQIMDTSDEWIVSRTGIHTRHMLADDENASDAGYIAAKRAIEDAQIEHESITHVIVATCTPDELSPSVACKIAGKLGLGVGSGAQTKTVKGVNCFDVNAACSGFIYGLEVARAFLALHPDATILLIAAEALTRKMNYNDRTTSVLFGDGAGAVVIRATDNYLFNVEDVSIGSDGSLHPLIRIGGGTSRKVCAGDTIEDDYFLTMQGRDVFKHAVRCMAGETEKLLERNGLCLQDIDRVIAHQANIRILDAVSQRLEIPEEKMIINVDRFGNTSASSILLALEEAREKKLVQPGNKILLTTFGAGLTWGSALLN